jgi:hypothetical protein
VRQTLVKRFSGRGLLRLQGRPRRRCRRVSWSPRSVSFTVSSGAVAGLTNLAGWSTLGGYFPSDTEGDWP